MRESLINPPKKDNEPVWFKLPNGSKRCFPKGSVAKMLADKNRGWELCEPEFVAKKQIRPLDEGKTATAMKNSTTELSGRQVEELLDGTVSDLRELAKKKNVALTGRTTKKSILEALEAAGELF